MNLLPDEEKKFIKKIYGLRLMIVAAYSFGLVLILAILPILSSYLIINYRINFLKSELAKIGSDITSGLDSYILSIKNTNKEIAILGQADPRRLPTGASDLIAAVLSALSSTNKIRGVHVSINSLSYAFQETSGVKTKQSSPEIYYPNEITLSGKAGDRLSLEKFVGFLKANPDFSQVISPLSNFVASKDLVFSLTIEVKK